MAAEAPIPESLLPPTKIKRKYQCSECEHITLNPREHLRHRQSVHQHNIRIVTCSFCQYACQYSQKLKRHMSLVHNNDTSQSMSPKIIDYQLTPTPMSVSYPGGVHNAASPSLPEPLDLSHPAKQLQRLIEAHSVF